MLALHLFQGAGQLIVRLVRGLQLPLELLDLPLHVMLDLQAGLERVDFHPQTFIVHPCSAHREQISSRFMSLIVLTCHAIFYLIDCGPIEGRSGLHEEILVRGRWR